MSRRNACLRLSLSGGHAWWCFFYGCSSVLSCVVGVLTTRPIRTRARIQRNSKALRRAPMGVNVRGLLGTGLRTMTRPKIATVLAFLAAPWVPAIVGATGTPITNASFATDLPNRLPLTLVFVFYSYAAIFVLAVPVYVALRRFGLVNVWSILAAGVLGGAVVAMLIRQPSFVTVSDFVSTCSMGLGSAVVFWLIWR